MIRRTLMPLAAGVALMAGAPASGTIITFTFNDSTLHSAIVAGVHNSELNGSAGTASVDTYMASVLAGSSEKGGFATSGYNADGNAIPGTTLGNTDGPYSTPNPYGSGTATSSPDDFLINNNLLSPTTADPQSDYIEIIIPAGTPIGSISFDYAIYPNVNCTSSTCVNNTSNGNFPDLEVKIPVISFDQTIDAFTRTTLDGYVTPFPSGGWDPQAIGHVTFSGLNINGSTETDIFFYDWPPEVGIDNLSIDTCLSSRGCLLENVPEPSPLPLAGLALALLVAFRRMARRRGGPAAVSQ